MALREVQHAATGAAQQLLDDTAPTTADLPSINLELWTTDLAIVTSVLSCFGSFLIIFFFLTYSDMRTTSREILAYLSLSNIVASVMVIWGVSWTSAYDSVVSSDDVQCQVQATVLIWAGIAEYLWTCALALYLFAIIVRGSPWGSRRCPDVLHVVCWGAGFVVAPLAFGLGKTGVDVQARNTAQWCILRDAKDPKIGSDAAYIVWSFIVGDGWSFLAIGCTLAFYLLIKWHIYKQKRNHSQAFSVMRSAMSAVVVVDRKLTWIPIVYFLLHIWGPIRTIISLSSKNNEVSLSTGQRALLALQTFGDCSEGITNGIIFVLFSPKLRQHIKEFFLTRLYRCCAKVRRRQTLRLQQAENEHARLIRGTIATTYAQESMSGTYSSSHQMPTSPGSINLPKKSQRTEQQASAAANLENEAAISTKTEKRSFAI